MIVADFRNSKCTVYVPAESVEKYKSAQGWNQLNIAITPSSSFEVDGNSYQVTSYAPAGVTLKKGVTEGNVEIPESVTFDGVTYAVKAVWYSAFSGTDISSVILPNTVDSIYSNAFNDCKNLETIVIGNGIKYIGRDFIYGCNSLTKIKIKTQIPPELAKSLWGGYFGTFDTDNCELYVPAESVNLYKQTEGWNEFSKILPLETDPNKPTLGEIFTDNGISYQITSLSPATVEVSKGNYAGDIVIPETLSFKGVTLSVTGIGSKAFMYNGRMDAGRLTSVKMPNTVTYIGDEAFYGSHNYLKSIELSQNLVSIGARAFSYMVYSSFTSSELVLPNSITEIGDFAFENTPINISALPTGLKKINQGVFQNCGSWITISEIPESVTEIGASAFYKCYGITSMKIPSGVKKIGERAFEHTRITEIELPEGITELANNIFRDCSVLESVILPNSITEFGWSVFEGCSSLLEIDIPNSVKEIGSGSFKGCKKLSKVVLSNSLTEIPSGLFEDCISLISLEIPDGIINVRSSAFKNCTAIGRIVFGKTVKDIASAVFTGCSSLNVIYSYNPLPPYLQKTGWGSEYFDNFNPDNCTLFVPNESIDLYKEANGWKEFNDVRTISADFWQVPFVGETFVEENLAYKIISLEPNAEVEVIFNNNSGNLVIPDNVFYKDTHLSVVGIGEEAFFFKYGIEPSLVSITLPNSVKYIGNRAFDNCSSLISINIPSSVTAIGAAAFYGCTGLTLIDIPNSVSTIGDCAFHGCSSLKSIEIPNSITKIGYQWFWYCCDLSSIKISDSVIEIETGAFQYCSNLSSIDFPKSITIIGDEAFGDCSSLTTLKIPNSVTKIGKKAFSRCSGLTSVEIPNSIIEIDNNTFEYCEGLTSLVIPNSVTKIGSSAFYGCSGLTSLKLPNSVTDIDKWAFGACTSLTSVEIPNSVYSIKEYTFGRCENLESIVLPKTIIEIEFGAFDGAFGLKSVTCYAIEPPKLNSSSFNYYQEEDVNLYVPASSIPLYIDSDWKEHFNEILPIPGFEGNTIIVNLPEDVVNGGYINMSLELADNNSEQRYKIAISDKSSYTFFGLNGETKYNLSMKNPWGDLLGKVEDIIVSEDEPTKVTFENLHQPKTVTMNIFTPEGEDVTDKVEVSWIKADGELMKQGASVSGVLEGNEIVYSVALPDDLLAYYTNPSKQTFKVTDKENNIRITLEPLEKVMFAGKIADANGKALPYSVLTISPMINGKYGNSVTVMTDADGQYEVELPNLPLKVTVSSNGYISQTFELQNAKEGLGSIALERISGLSVFVTTDYSDQMNVAFRALDLTGNELEGCLYQATSIVLPNSVGIGDELIVVAYSKNGKFKDVAKTVVLDSKNTSVEISIVEYGQLDVKCEGNGFGFVAILYNNVGELVGKTSFREGVASFETIPDGTYSIVAMKKSTYFNSILNLSALDGAGLAEGTDYLLETATAETGKVTEVTVGNIPELDEARLYLATGNGTYFMPNKPELTIGKYQTLKAKVELKKEYLERATDATLVVDIPSSCEFVDGSVITGTSFVYQKDGNRIFIPLESVGDLVRFCVIPYEAGEIRPNAFVKMTIDNGEVVLPIGSAYFEAKGFSLSCVEKTSRTTIALRGTAMPDSEVLIYDNETLVGKTTSLGNGQWTANITFAKPYSHSFHEIYGEVITSDSKRLLTETKLVEYDKNYVDIEKVSMLYSNGYDHKIYDVEFDPLSGTTSCGYYNYYPSSVDFTFTADISNSDPLLISSLNFKVLASDGTTRTLEGKYNEATGKWVASSKYDDTHKLPMNVKVEYMLTNISSNYDKEMEKDLYDEFNKSIETVSSLFENGEIDIISSSDNVTYISVIPEGEDEMEYFKFERMEYTTLKEELGEWVYKIENDSTNICVKDTIIDNSYCLYIIDDRNKEAFSMSYYGTNYANVPIYNTRFLPLLIGGIGGLAISYYERNLKQKLLKQWYMYLGSDYSELADLYNALYKILYKMCDKNNYKVNNINKRLELQNKIENWSNKRNKFLSKLERQIKNLGNYYNSVYTSQIVSQMSISLIFSKLGEIAINSVPKDNVISFLLKDIGLTGVSEANSNLYSKIFDDLFINKGQSIEEALGNWHYDEYKKLVNEFREISDEINKNSPDCEDSDDPNKPDDGHGNADDFPTPPVTPSIDPSGYVYEAVPSNRLEGVTATVYFLQETEDMYGEITGDPVIWDATAFGQKNPLTTDAQGMYAWDVPQGMWQVKFEKEGYETTFSEWLPVPPPQLDVNIPMVQAKQPEVKNLHAYTDGITIEFDKFMLPTTLTKENIKVSQNGTEFDGIVTFINSEKDGKGNSYCSKIEFVPNKELAEGEATVIVRKNVKSYAEIQMNEDFKQTVKVEQRVRDLNVNDTIKIFSGYSVKIEGSVLPISAGAGKKFILEEQNPYIAAVDQNSITNDGNGNISFDVVGLIPGKTIVRIALEGYDFHKDVMINVLEANTVATPTASLPSGTVVKKGTGISLNCETEGATIYYTTDDSCPCDIATAKVYDGTPIIINEAVAIKAMAMKQDMFDSNVAEFVYFVENDDAIETITSEDVALRIYPLPMRDVVNISFGGKEITNVSINTVNGSVVRNIETSGTVVQLDVQSIPVGVYIINVTTSDEMLHKKVLKVE